MREPYPKIQNRSSFLFIASVADDSLLQWLDCDIAFVEAALSVFGESSFDVRAENNDGVNWGKLLTKAVMLIIRMKQTARQFMQLKMVYDIDTNIRPAPDRKRNSKKWLRVIFVEVCVQSGDDFLLDLLQDALQNDLEKLSLSGNKPFISQASFWETEGGGDNPANGAPLLDRNNGFLEAKEGANQNILQRAGR